MKSGKKSSKKKPVQPEPEDDHSQSQDYNSMPIEHFSQPNPTNEEAKLDELSQSEPMDSEIIQNPEQNDDEEDEDEEDDEEAIEIKSEKTREFMQKMLEEMEPIDSDDPEGKRPAFMLRDHHGYEMLKIMEKNLKVINKSVREGKWVDAFDMMYGFVIAMKMQDYWTQVDDGEYVTEMCERINKVWAKVVKGLGKNAKQMSKEQKEDVRKSIEVVSDFGESLEGYGIDTFIVDKEALLKLF